MIIGSHVSMSGKDMLLGSVKEAVSYGANTFMFYTGAPQNTRRKKIEELRAILADEKLLLRSTILAAANKMYLDCCFNALRQEENLWDTILPDLA